MPPGDLAWCWEHHPDVFDAWTHALERRETQTRQRDRLSRLKERFGRGG